MPTNLFPYRGTQVQPGCCKCWNCSGKRPPAMRCTISGLVDYSVDPICTSCDDFNTTFLLEPPEVVLDPGDVWNVSAPQYAPSFGWGPYVVREPIRYCSWIYRFPSPTCDIVGLVLYIDRVPPDPWRLQFEMIEDAPNSGSSVIFTHYFDDSPLTDPPPPCEIPAGGLDLAFEAYAGSAANICVATGAIVHVESVWN